MSIRQLASALKLSPGTISRSLRHHPDIPSNTRNMVIQAAAELGYTPRVWTPRRLAERLNKPSGLRSIGVLIGDGYGLAPTSVGSSFLAHYFLAGIHGAALATDVTTSTAFIEKNELSRLENPVNYPPLLRGARLDGLILIYPFPEAVVSQLASRWPCISIERHDARGLIDSVGHGQLPAITQSVAYLHKLGHRRIGFVADIHTSGQRLAVHERYAGYNIGLDRFDLEHDESIVIGMKGRRGDEPPSAEPTSREPMTDEQLPARVAACARAGVTAWVCALDRQAYLLMRELPKLGLRVPNDVSIVGYSGIDPLYGLDQLTTWRVPYEHIGAAAVEAVLARAAQPNQPVVSREYPCDFVIGTTTAPLKNG